MVKTQSVVGVMQKGGSSFPVTGIDLASLRAISQGKKLCYEIVTFDVRLLVALENVGSVLSSQNFSHYLFPASKRTKEADQETRAHFRIGEARNFHRGVHGSERHCNKSAWNS